MPLIATRGAASVQGFGEFAQTTAPVYIEDVFSTYLYTGNGSTQTITNNIDLSGEGGLVWTKNRTGSSATHQFIDTVRGKNSALASQNTDSALGASDITSFNAAGFSLGYITGNSNFNGDTYASWTFREQPKFFDIVTYTGNGSGSRNISHNLGSAPGCIIIKCTSTTSNWMVWHRSISGQDNLYLNSTAGTSGVASDPISVPGFPSSLSTTEFNVSTGTDSCNTNGETYVAYLFAHDAGGFGLTGSDNVITCGSYTGTGSAQTLSLGYEPQWVLIKQSSGANDWNIWDNMRGLVVGGTDAYLQPNTSNAENSLGAYDFLSPTATGLTIDPTSAGFNYVNTNGQTYIYIAIRRGPMKTPTVGTEVFYPKVHAGTSSYSVGFPTDLCLAADQSGNSLNTVAVYRLAGNNAYFGGTASTAAEVSVSVCQFDLQNSFQLSYNNNNQARWHFRRAPGFFDVVCYTGDGASSRSITHNLGVKPEFIIVKRRSSTGYWATGHGTSGLLFALNTTNAGTSSTSTAGVSANGYVWIDDGTTTTFKVIAGDTDSTAVNASGSTYVAYLFASVSGVSKVGSYTGTGALQTVNCGFTGGARFVLIKRTDSTGDWWVYDSARGISSGNDPYLFLNSTAAEVTNTNYVDTTSVGFQVTAAAPAGLNANGGTFIFLAVA